MSFKEFSLKFPSAQGAPSTKKPEAKSDDAPAAADQPSTQPDMTPAGVTPAPKP